MHLAELKSLFVFIQQAPVGIRQPLEWTVWVLVFLLLLWAILKILLTKQFKELYRVIGIGAQRAGEAGKTVVRAAARDLELPEPYPRVTRLFAIVFMLNNYLGFFLFGVFGLVLLMIIVFLKVSSPWGRIGGTLIFLVVAYAAWFLFAQAERDRVRLFAKNDAKDI